MQSEAPIENGATKFHSDYKLGGCPYHIAMFIQRINLPAVIKSLVVVTCLLLAGFSVAAQESKKLEGYIFSVRLVNPVNVPDDSSQETMKLFGPVIGLSALGAVVPPMYAGALIVGGLILAPSVLTLSTVERQRWQAIADALKGLSFEKNLLSALQRRAMGALPPRSGSVITVELVVNAYGLVARKPQYACFLAMAELRVAIEGKVLLRDQIVISDLDKTRDAPPAQCASLERFAERDGQLVLDTAAEISEVFAVMSIDRILGSIHE